MDKDTFDRAVESMIQVGDVVRSEREPSRVCLIIDESERVYNKTGLTLMQVLEQRDELLEALDELTDLMDGVLEGDYTPDSFTTQPARIAIAKAKGEQA